jgi:hypothetical protein
MIKESNMKYTIIEAVQEFGPIVHVDEDLGFIFCWNRSHTFHVLTAFNGLYQVADSFQNYDVERTDSLSKVISKCECYCANLYDELNEEYA